MLAAHRLRAGPARPRAAGHARARAAGHRCAATSAAADRRALRHPRPRHGRRGARVAVRAATSPRRRAPRPRARGRAPARRPCLPAARPRACAHAAGAGQRNRARRARPHAAAIGRAAIARAGEANKLICRDLRLSEGTVKVHVSAILRALNCPHARAGDRRACAPRRRPASSPARSSAAPSPRWRRSRESPRPTSPRARRPGALAYGSLPRTTISMLLGRRSSVARCGA